MSNWFKTYTKWLSYCIGFSSSRKFWDRLWRFLSCIGKSLCWCGNAGLEARRHFHISHKININCGQCGLCPTIFPTKVSVHWKAAVAYILRQSKIKAQESNLAALIQPWVQHVLEGLVQTSCLFCWQTSGCRWRSCTMERQCWKQQPQALRGVSSCRVKSSSPTNGSMGPAAPSRSASRPRRPYRYRNSWQTQWTDFSVIWRRGFCYGWPRMGCSLRGSAEAECTGVDPWPKALAIPTN